MKNNELVLILERSNSNLKIDKDSGDYILEGVFAQFGVENNNKRIYEEDEYLPHLKYLQKKIDVNTLMGELDHPEKFEISLQKVSHIVEKLEYKKDKREIHGRVRLLDTPSGKIAKSLVDSGVPISISSRAAGSVNENKKVSIKKIFTFDLVADPGFESAQLHKMNESLGLSNDDKLQVFSVEGEGWQLEENSNNQTTKANELDIFATNIFEKFKDSENAKIQEINADFLKKRLSSDIYINKIMEFNMENNKTGNSNLQEENFVTVDALNRYSTHITNEFNKIKEKLNNISEENSSESFSKVSELKEEVKKLKKYTNYLADEINTTREFTDYLRESVVNEFNIVKENLSTLENYTEQELVEKVNLLIDYTEEEITENVNNLVDFTNKLKNYTETELGENLNHLINYTETVIKENLEDSIEFSDSVIRENLNTLINYTDTEIKENLDSLIGYNEYLKEEISNNRSFANYIAENATSEKELKMLAENNNLDYTELTRNTNNNTILNENNNSTIDINEKLKSIDSIDDKIDSLLEEVKKEKTNQSSKYPFINQFSKANQNRFARLDETKKEKVKNAILRTDFPKLNENELVDIWETAIKEEIENPIWLQKAPQEYREIYENLNETEQNRIKSAAAWYEPKLQTEYQVKNFWETRGLKENVELRKEEDKLKSINENSNSKDTKITESKAVNNNFGYDKKYVEDIAKGLDRFNQ